ncbi:MAG: AAA family ATPase [Bacteroidetes bacterium]|nr:AAA family ATPase [Bacteroidota bacterium]
MNNLVIPENLYGREIEIEALFESFERISRGVGEILTVPGTSGVGKTALVQELEMPVKNQNGFFVSGKFEQFQQNIPYFAFKQALTTLCHIILAEDQPIQERYKTEILDAVGLQGRVLVDLVPEFISLLGEQPPLGEISPQEARYRFTDVLRKFLSVISKPEHPLVLFIDDWQWADTASFELLKQLEVGNTLRYILVILSYRDNEVNSSHPLTATLDELKRNNITLNQLKLRNLIQSDVQNMLEDTLQPDAEHTKELAAIIHKKTRGNPFFVHAAINYLSDFKLLWFNESENIWKWKTDLESGIDFPDNVIDLFVRKFQRMDRHAQILYSLAACLGNRFHVKNLEIISDFSLEECKSILSSPDGKEFAVPLKGIQKRAISQDEPETDVYIFRHDRLQQAAFLLIGEERHSMILHKIGKVLFAELSPEQLNERFFEVVNNLNAGIELIETAEDREELFRLNIMAAKKAYTAIAYASALQFYRKAAKILEKEGFSERMWKKDHDLLMKYLNERAVCEFLEGDQEIAEQYVHQAVKSANSAVEKAVAYNILIVQHTLQARYQEAITSGKSALKALGIILPEKDYDKARDKEIAKVKEQLKNRDISSLSQLPNMSKPEMLTACKILITMGPPCYRAHQKLWSVIVPIVVGLTLKYGNIPQVGYSHTAFGGLLGWVEDDFVSAKKFADVAAQLMTEKFSIPSEQSVFYLMNGSSICHWFKHLKYSSQDYIDAYEIGLRSGNLQYAAYAFGHNMYCRFYQGVSLESLTMETKQSLEFSKTRHNQWAIDLFTGGLKIVDALRTNSYGDSLEKIGNDSDYMISVDAHKNIQVKCIYKVLKTFSLLLLGNYKDALVVSDETEPIIYTVGTQGLLPWPEHVFARILIYAQLYSEKDATEQKKWLKEIKEGIQKLKIWADFCPENFEHKYLLATAELNIIEGQPAKALQNYYKAADAAQENEFLQWEGLANERMYEFWLEKENHHLAFHYWKQAYVCYQHWGATAKLKQMENDYVDYLKKSISAVDLAKTEGVEKGIFSKWLIEKQLTQVQKLASHLYQSKLSLAAMNQAEELASATKRLRTEISYRKQAEEEVKLKNRDLEKINAEKDKFFSIIAHDLKSPFNSIIGLSEILVEQINEKNFDGIEKYAGIILNSSQRAMDLLMNLMEWSRSQTGRMEFNPGQFDLTEFIHEIIPMFDDIAGQKGIVIKKELPPEATVYADQDMINTVLRNLISNAIKFTKTGGEIILTVTKDKNEFIVSVKDTGIGMSKDRIEKLFRIEASESTSGTANEKGTGLGLILCKEFVEKHEEKIWVISEEGKGSTFYFTLSDTK